jgi:ubiquinone/menaquinone biosynthesis C-methylase UbiE
MITSIGDKVPGAQLIGLDISDSIYQAADKAVAMENVNFMKADLLKPPFRQDSFDYIFSAGVLHHTPNVFESLKSLYMLLKPGGRIYVWLYPSYIFCAYDFTRRLIPGAWRLPSPARFVLSLALAPLLKLFFLITKLHSQKTSPESLATIAFRIFDNISPEFQSRHSKEEVSEWVLKLGASSYEIVNDLGVVIQK